MNIIIMFLTFTETPLEIASSKKDTFPRRDASCKGVGISSEFSSTKDIHNN